MNIAVNAPELSKRLFFICCESESLIIKKEKIILKLIQTSFTINYTTLNVQVPQSRVSACLKVKPSLFGSY